MYVQTIDRTNQQTLLKSSLSISLSIYLVVHQNNKLQHGTMVMSKVASYTFPDAAAWPFVWIDGYWDIASSVLPTSCYTGIHFAPLVQPAQSAAFEAFAYGKFADTFGENTTMGAYSHFGKGIWGTYALGSMEWRGRRTNLTDGSHASTRPNKHIHTHTPSHTHSPFLHYFHPLFLYVVQDASIDTEDHRLHDTTGISRHGSPYQLLVPKLQHALGDSPWVMMNAHGFKRQGEALDAVINCTQFQRATARDPTQVNCQALSAMNPPKDDDDHRGPFGFIATPIFPANDPDTLTGFIFGAVFWSEVMEDMVRYGR